MESPAARHGDRGPTSSASSRSGRALSRAGAEALARDLDAQGLSDEYDPTGACILASSRSGAAAEGSAGGGEARGRRVGWRTDRGPPRWTRGDKRMFLTAPGHPRPGPVQCHIIRRKGGGGGCSRSSAGAGTRVLPLPGTRQRPGSRARRLSFLLSARKREEEQVEQLRHLARRGRPGAAERELLRNCVRTSWARSSPSTTRARSPGRNTSGKARRRSRSGRSSVR